MNLIRLIVILGVACTAVYVVLAWYLRSTCRERLEHEWDAANPGADPASRASDVEKGVVAFTQTLGYRALWLIYIVPVALVTLSYFMTN